MSQLVFWIDVDNTLLNNDQVKAELDRGLRTLLGEGLTERFWNLYEAVRHESGVVDIPQTLRHLREQTPLSELSDEAFQQVRALFEHYPFATALYPGALEVLEHLSHLGLTVIVSDGDHLFQAEKIAHSHLAEAVSGRVLIYDHKERHLEETMRRYPGEHYVAIDDRLDLLAACKAQLGEKLTTVFVRQGRHAEQGLRQPGHYQADRSVAAIAELRHCREKDFMPVRGSF
ncbi:HAD family hydrolase [Thermogemmatispora sp.]|uniref:HAD family hydrolase n=1 Tax=Thermogemmatispora sp. TaxID=1968838 RepID=UPI001DCDD7D1|nr:HAD family hydrolase [Thermogemmatispora sp.]MBX5451470.1 HAD family hydrolase [Thermogemmatispora sp.]